MAAKLLFLDGDMKGEFVDLKSEGTSLGRETDNDIILQEGEISRHHARILEKDGEWIFKDLGSSAGTTVNDLPVKEGEQVLIPGDVIIMGRHKFKFEPGVGDMTMIGGMQAPKIGLPEDDKAPEADEAKPEPAADEKPEVADDTPEVKEDTVTPSVGELGENEETIEFALKPEKTEDPAHEEDKSEEESAPEAEPSPEPAEEKEEADVASEPIAEEPAEEKVESPYAKNEPDKEVAALDDPVKEEETPLAEKEPAKQESKPSVSAVAASAAPKKGGGKVLFGCGGCGCFLTLLLIGFGIFCFLMRNDSHMDEFGPFAYIVTPIGFFFGIVSLVLLIIAFAKKKKS